jgi:hypothetical protein
MFTDDDTGNGGRDRGELSAHIDWSIGPRVKDLVMAHSAPAIEDDA